VDSALIDPKDVEFKLELEGPLPLPFQAIRLQAILINTSRIKLERLFRIEQIQHSEFKGPEDKEFQEASSDLRLENVGRPSSNGTIRSWSNQNSQVLQPGEELSATYSFSAHWHSHKEIFLTPDKVEPFFPKPGRYKIKVIYRQEDEEQQQIEQTITVQVQEPRGDDKDVCELLQKDPPLMAELLSPISRPDDKMLAKIQDLLKQYPKSSYAPSAQFAVARHFAVKQGKDHRVYRAMAATELSDLGNFNWPYQANSLFKMREAAPTEKKSIDADLKFRCPDAVEALEALGGTMRPEDWRAIRKRTSPKD
jgi:hypothetical protein